MPDHTMPTMATLAPLVDEVIAIAEQELPAPRTAHIRLYDDGTYRLRVEHSHADGTEAVVYHPDTGAVYWYDTAGARRIYPQDPVTHDTIITTTFAEDASRHITTIEPPG